VVRGETIIIGLRIESISNDVCCVLPHKAIIEFDIVSHGVELRLLVIQAMSQAIGPNGATNNFGRLVQVATQEQQFSVEDSILCRLLINRTANSIDWISNLR
jgi:hypothetical protein